MKIYPDYKSIDQLWLEEIPGEWQTIKIKYAFEERSEKGYPDEPLLVASQNMGVVPKSLYGNRTVEAQKDLHLLKLVRIGDFVISLRSFQGGIEYAYYQGIISPAYTIMVSKDILTSGYFRYLAKSYSFIELLKTCVTGIREGQNIDYSKLRNYRIPVPPRPEQEQIMRFLDWKVSAINRLINIKRKEIRAIDTMKRSLVCDAVTHGLNTDVPMKYSGVRWLGDIPAHWSIIKLRQILHPVSVKNHPELPLLSVAREQGVIVRNMEDKEANHNFIPDDLSNYKVVKSGQFAMNKMKAWQGSYGISGYTGIVSPAYFIFDVSFPNLEYFHYAIRSKVYVNFFAQASDGIRVGQWDLQMDKMKEIPFIVPPADEQIAIVEHIKAAIPQCEAVIEKLLSEVGTLKECKTRLISDVVTGRLDVRGIEIPECEFVEEDADGESEESVEPVEGEADEE